MFTRLWVVLLTTTALAALVGTASARIFDINNTNTGFRVTYRSLEFRSLVTIRCELTLEGSFHTRTIAKVLESLIGHITRATFKHPCTNGEWFAYNGTENLGGATIANSLPWHVRYAGFIGTLPNIERGRVGFSDVRWLITALGVRCIFTTGPARGLAFGTFTRNLGTRAVDNLVASGRIRFDAGSGELCGGEGEFVSGAADGLITLLGTSNRISISLI